MLVDVYIGLADDPTFKWEGGDWNGNVPKRITPPFPCVHRSVEDLKHRNPLSYDSKSWAMACSDFGLNLIQLDWGAFGTKISKTQILSLLTRFAPTSSNELLSCVQNLNDDTDYALIIAETGGIGIEDELDELGLL